MLNEIVNIAKECNSLSRFHKIIGGSIFVVNFCLIWVVSEISEFFVMLMRLDESNGYMLTDEQEVMYFLAISIPMFCIQSLFLLFLLVYLKKKLYKKSTLILNFIGHSLLFLWFIFKAYQFTIIDY